MGGAPVGRVASTADSLILAAAPTETSTH